MDELMAILSMIGTLILMIGVFVGAYFVSKWVAKKYSPTGGSSMGNIEILDRSSLGKDQHLVLVRSGGKVLLLGVTAHNIQKIDELDPETITINDAPVPAKVDFVNVLKDAFQKRNLK